VIGYLLRRLLATVPVLVAVAVTIFLLLRLTPGDPAAVIAGEDARPEHLEKIREHLGLNRPIHAQFIAWLGRLVQGDFGTSIISGTPVLEMILGRIEPTFSVAIGTIVLSVLLAIPMGVLAAAHRGTLIDRAVVAVSVLGFSVPVFVIGYALIQLFAIELKWFPVQGFRSITEGFGPFVHRIVLPTLTLTLLYIALITRITRTSLLEVLGEDFIRTARAKGISGAAVLLRHALRNAAVPIVTVIGIGFALLITGVVVTESVFNLPGIGRLTIDAVLARDYPVIQGVTLLASLLYVAVNLLIDLSYVLLDPRIRY
jgi:peptide/nickel transport system permease protein